MQVLYSSKNNLFVYLNLCTNHKENFIGFSKLNFDANWATTRARNSDAPKGKLINLKNNVVGTYDCNAETFFSMP